ncbi:hypothetical protein I314_04548 [Cryptococcus bacillisporus CA1873]|uniref:WD40 repeat-like protein n=1 Tax=Cryptococcus bacillisporus CA1873 TaxID=1296111 RepID=A0ABR5B7I6_CRYGA|nr:hypothetical protein I314_04548 [Cryptococcus bacillisporus CA1873]|eukprot:KIR59559.1 hypothetical protein I314_04548 [Cryptococcus gattii CA1873]
MSSITLLSTHASSLSLSTLSKPFASPLAPSSVTLPLPSRFPKNSNPAVAISPSGHIFLYNSESSFIWEYDSKGRRISEIALGKEEKAGKVACWEDGIVLSVRKQVRIMMKDYEGKIGRWHCSKMFEELEDSITALCTDGKLVAVGSEAGKLVVFEMNTGSMTSLPLNEDFSGPISSSIAFFSSLPNTLVIPSVISPTLLRITFPVPLNACSPQLQLIRPFSPSNDAPIRNLAFSPMTVTSSGDKKGGLCALVAGEEVVLVGLDREKPGLGKRIKFGRKVDALGFLDGATLGGRTDRGSLLIKDLRALEKVPVEMGLKDPILSARVMPSGSCLPRPRATVTSTISASHRSTLGEVDNNLPAHPDTQGAKGKGKALISRIKEEKSQLRAVSTSAVEDGERAGRREERKERRSISGPVSSTNQPRERRIRHSDMGSKPRVIEAIQEEEPGQSKHVAGLSSGRHGQPSSTASQSEPQEEPSIDLTWALRPSASRTQLPTKSIEKAMTDEEKIAELRREIGNLQLDILRMGRTFRNEIRQAVQPLAEEIRRSKEIIEEQGQEIARLRAGR